MRSPREGSGFFGPHYIAGTQDSRNMNYLLVEGAKATRWAPGSGARRILQGRTGSNVWWCALPTGSPPLFSH